jgi:hypothetical protein
MLFGAGMVHIDKIYQLRLWDMCKCIACTYVLHELARNVAWTLVPNLTRNVGHTQIRTVAHSKSLIRNVEHTAELTT